MPSRTPSSFTTWVLISLPLLLMVGVCFTIIGGEEAVATYFAAWRSEHQDALRLIKIYNDWGNPVLSLVYAAILLRGLACRRRDLTAFALAYLAGQFLVCFAVAGVLKVGVGRPRPGVGGPFIPLSFDAEHNSMPSGHTTEMTLQTSALALRVRGCLSPLLLGLALGLMGACRLMLGEHHPSDLLGSWVLGGMGGYFIHYLTPRLAARLPATWKH